MAKIYNWQTRGLIYESHGTVAETLTYGVKVGIDFAYAYLRGEDLSESNLYSAKLYRANLNNAKLSGAVLHYAGLGFANLVCADLVGAHLHRSVLRHAHLTDAVLTGAYLDTADLHGADLEGVDLRYSVLRNSDLTGTDLRNSDLTRANLLMAKIHGTILRGAKMIEAILPGDVPVLANIHQTVYAAVCQSGALDMSDWLCGTTHYWAGHIVRACGEAGRLAKGRFNSSIAAALIFAKNDRLGERLPNWYACDEDVLAEMKRLAEAEAALDKQTQTP